MQTVLSIDVSSEIAEAIVANIDGKKIDIIEQHRLPISSFMPVLAEEPSPSSSTNETEENVAPSSKESLPPASDGLAQLLSKIQTPWTNAILVIPARDFITLNLEMPFSDSKSINRILDLEVQDLVPFEVSDFILSHRLIAPISGQPEISSKFDVHVGVMAKSYIREILKNCKAASFEPLIVTTPSSVLGALFSLAPDYFLEDSAILLERLPNLYLLTCLNGQIKTERTIRHASFEALHNNGNGTHSHNLQEGNKLLLTDLKLTLASAEQHYSKNLDRIYYLGKSFSQSELQSHLGRNVELINIQEIVPVESEQTGIAALASLYAEDNYAPKIFCNFRSREFAYSPQLKELYRGLKALTPYFLVLAAALLVYYAASYFITQYNITRLNSSIHTEIAKVIPGIGDQGDDELTALQKQNQQLEDQLKDISTLSSMTPLEILKEISKDLPASLGVSITSGKIKDNKITIEGSAKNYADVDKVEKILQKNPLYQRVKKGESSGGSSANGTRSFSFELWVGE